MGDSFLNEINSHFEFLMMVKIVHIVLITSHIFNMEFHLNFSISTVVYVWGWFVIVLSVFAVIHIRRQATHKSKIHLLSKSVWSTDVIQLLARNKDDLVCKEKHGKTQSNWNNLFVDERGMYLTIAN